MFVLLYHALTLNDTKHQKLSPYIHCTTLELCLVLLGRGSMHIAFTPRDLLAASWFRIPHTLSLNKTHLMHKIQYNLDFILRMQAFFLFCVIINKH